MCFNPFKQHLERPPDLSFHTFCPQRVFSAIPTPASQGSIKSIKLSKWLIWWLSVQKCVLVFFLLLLLSFYNPSESVMQPSGVTIHSLRMETQDAILSMVNSRGSTQAFTLHRRRATELQEVRIWGHRNTFNNLGGKLNSVPGNLNAWRLLLTVQVWRFRFWG